MVVTDNFTLPTYEELEVEEVPLSTPALRAGAFHMGKYCEYQNNEFMLCRKELGDPRKCVKEGKDVTNCSMDFFRKVKKLCYNEFERYAFCIDKSHHSYEFQPCRKTQHAFDECMINNMGIERPPFDYYCLAKIHDSKRPKPEPLPLMVFEGTPPSPETDNPPPKQPSKYHSRIWFFKY